MAKRKLALSDVGWERLSEAEKRAPHVPTEMISGNSKGPIKMWLCSRPGCDSIEYQYNARSNVTPICGGGMRWSFLTSGPYDAGVHKEWLG